MDAELQADIACSLTELQDELLIYERNQENRQNVNCRDSLQLLLRRTHSLKGVLRLAERPESASLIHLVESLLVRHNENEAPLSKAEIDLVFDALDGIVGGFETTTEDVPHLRRVAYRINSALTASVPAASDIRRFPFVPTRDEYEACSAARSAGKQLYCVEKAIRSDLSEQVFDALPTREDLAATGEIIAFRPSYANLDRTRSEALLSFVVATAKSRAELELLVFDDWFFCRWPDSLLPAEAPVALKAPRAQQESKEDLGKRFLVVEDDPTCQIVLVSMLKRCGHCDTASNGKDALAAFRRALAAKCYYDAVCLDIMMPGMDGHTVLKEIRLLEAEAAVPAANSTKVIMTTALSSYDHFHQAFVEQCDSYLVKPVSKNALERQLARLGVIRSQIGA